MRNSITHVFMPRLACAVILLGLSACASEPCTGNPNTDSLGCVQRGISSGDYDRNTQAAKARAEYMQQQAAAAQAENARLRNQIAANQSEEKALRDRIARQRAELQDLSNRVVQLSKDGRLSPAEAAARQNQVESLRKRQADVQQPNGNAREQQEKVKALQSEIDALNDFLARAK